MLSFLSSDGSLVFPLSGHRAYTPKKKSVPPTCPSPCIMPSLQGAFQVYAGVVMWKASMSVAKEMGRKSEQEYDAVCDKDCIAMDIRKE